MAHIFSELSNCSLQSMISLSNYSHKTSLTRQIVGIRIASILNREHHAHL